MAALRPPKFLQIFDWRLLVTLALTLLIGAMACDLIHDRAARALSPDPVTSPNPTRWTKGRTATLDLALASTDYHGSDCAAKGHLEGYRCQYKQNLSRFEWPKVTPRPVPVDNNRGYFIQPYRTAHQGHLLFIAGLWATPGVAYRVHQEKVPETGAAVSFIARCQLRFLGEFNNVYSRWKKNGAWEAHAKTPVALAERCTVNPPAVGWLAQY